MSAPAITVRPVQIAVDDDRITSLDVTTGIFLDDRYLGLTWDRSEALRFADELRALPERELVTLRDECDGDYGLVAVGTAVIS